MKNAGFLDAHGQLIGKDKLPDRVAARWEKGASPYLPSSSIRKQAKAAADAAGSFAAMRDAREVHETLAYFAMLPVAKVGPIDDEDERSRLGRAADGLLGVSRTAMTGVLTAGAFLRQGGC